MEPVTAAELGQWIGISSKSVVEAEKSGAVVKVAPGRYDLKQSVQRYIADVKAARKAAGGESAASERAKLASAQAESFAIRNAKARGELVPAADVERTWTDTLRGVRSAMLAIPSRLGGRLSQLTQADIAVIDEEVRTA